eukprot:c1601_g1_i2.p1 GENE.c1601_g1_i2~~c1601_g1_i2.p1  ORF type:complete len:202 (+),score=42.51 c1601_g1_i2:81-686(+)
MTTMSHVPSLAVQISHFIESLCCPNSIDSEFKCITPPPIHLLDYVDRLITFSQCSQNVPYVTAVLLARLQSKLPNLFCAFSAHKLFATALVIAIKLEDDIHFTNTFYADCAGVCLLEINYLEGLYLHLLGYSVFVHPDDTSEMASKLTATPDWNMFVGDFLDLGASSPANDDSQYTGKRVPSLEILDEDWSSLINMDAIFD